MYKYLTSALCVGMMLAPLITNAAPFGGSIGTIVPCYNDGARYALVGPPDGGAFVWTPATMTYQFGPPSHSGQWLLGLYGVPYYCIVSIEPIIVWPGLDITMMGSSQ